MEAQKTIKKAASLTGTGLHSGEQATVTLYPAPENHGIKFVRTDCENAPEIEADIDNVVDLVRGTAIGRKDIKIFSIEHCMSALSGMEIDNCRVEVTTGELPLLDGSSFPYVELIKNAGIQKQDEPRNYITIDKPILLYQDNDTAYSLFPSSHFNMTLMIDYSHKHPVVGVQHTTLYNREDYEKEFAPARTFCFLSEIETLREQGRIKGGSLDSAVVVQDIDLTEEHIAYMRRLFDYDGPIEPGKNGFLNNAQLRFYNELCRHKAVDLIGDLYLLGRPIQGHVLAAKTSHETNHKFAQKIRKYIRKREKEKKENGLDVKDIMQILPHRYPFLLIDRVEEVEPDTHAVCVKNVSMNEPFFQGHFPGEPVMPGVLQVEAMAQAGGIMGLYGKKGTTGKRIYFMGVDHARFRGAVRPGDVLRVEVHVIKRRRDTMRFSGKCFVRNNLVCEAELLAMLA
jgi:UDP-3-O-[3-hydroxymyristoyl] N-acetylglucosamine deacetylase/3-hydroxyacyl-[acyl-carrier-protein] dehydratase